MAFGIFFLNFWGPDISHNVSNFGIGGDMSKDVREVG